MNGDTIALVGVSWIVKLTAQPRGTPPAPMHNLRHIKGAAPARRHPDCDDDAHPHVTPYERVTVPPLGRDLSNTALRYGLMDEPNVPEALASAGDHGLVIDVSDVSYFLGRETVIVTNHRGWRRGGSGCSC